VSPCADVESVPIIPEIVHSQAQEAFTVNLEEIGKRIDKELERLRIFVDTELKPTTRDKGAAALRTASKKLAKLADELEVRLAEKK
jgi:hypothetical protein